MHRDPGIRLNFKSENRGLGAGCNLGVRNASGRYLVFLNPNTRFLNDVVTELAGFMDGHPLGAATGPTSTTTFVLMRPGHCRLSLMNFRQHSSLTFRFPRWSWASKPYMPGWDYRSTREVRIG